MDKQHESHQHVGRHADTDLHDPVCGMTVTTESEHSFIRADQHYYFCSAGCLEKFRAAPEQYPDSRAQEPAQNQQSRNYTCPMHPEVRQSGPGTCPKCGMALEPETPSLATRVQYTCPMHPEIVRDQPGQCPKCGMALEAMTVSLDDDENPELVDMTRRFRVSAVVTLPLVILAMGSLSGCLSNGWQDREYSVGQSWCWPPRWCCGVVGHSLCVAGSLLSTAASTCSR